MIVDINKLKILLKFDGIDCSNFSDEEFEVIVNSKLHELEGFIGADIIPHNRRFISHDFKGGVLELGFYPIISVHRILVDDECLPKTEYNVNNDLGIVYFKDRIIGSYRKVKVEYTSGISDRDFNSLIVPLVKDMVGYTVSFGIANGNLGGYGFLSNSLHEGDVSVTFANGSKGSSNVDYGYNSGINSTIDELRKRYSVSARVRWL